MPYLPQALIERILQIPSIAAAVEEHQEIERSAEAAARAVLVERLLAAEAALPKLEAAMEAQEKKFEEIKAVYHQERGRLGQCQQKLNEGSRAVHSALLALRDHGGQEIADTDRRIALAIVRTSDEIAAREALKPRRSMTGIIIDKEAEDENKAALNALRRKLTTLKESSASMVALRTSKLSPGEVRQQCADIEIACGLRDE